MVASQTKKLLTTAFYALVLGLLWAPTALAETAQNFKLLGGNEAQKAPKTVAEIACIVTKLALDFIPYLMLIAVGEFLMGLIKYIGHGDNEEKRTEGIKMMIYGTLGFFFMVSVWGIMRLAGAGLGFDVLIPQFKSGGVPAFTCGK